MNLSLLSTFAAAVSAVAVLLSLLLLKRQIDQSEKNQRALIQQGRASRSAEIAMRLMDSDFAEAYHRCMTGDANVPASQLVQFIGYCRAVFLGAEDSYLQHRELLLDEPAFNSFERALRGVFVSPGIRASWAILREWYDPGFAAFVDAIVEQIVDDAANQLYSVQHDEWKAAVATQVIRKRAA